MQKFQSLIFVVRKVYIQDCIQDYIQDYIVTFKTINKVNGLFLKKKLLGVTAASIYALAVIHNINNT